MEKIDFDNPETFAFEKITDPEDIPGLSADTEQKESEECLEAVEKMEMTPIDEAEVEQEVKIDDENPKNLIDDKPTDNLEELSEEELLKEDEPETVETLVESPQQDGVIESNAIEKDVTESVSIDEKVDTPVEEKIIDDLPQNKVCEEKNKKELEAVMTTEDAPPTEEKVKDVQMAEGAIPKDESPKKDPPKKEQL